jgi:hypothetical protein
VSMTKFVESGKQECPVSYFGPFGFGNIRVKPSMELNSKDLKIKCVLRHGKGLKGIKNPGWKKSKPKAEAAKTGLFNFGYWSIRFSQNR